MAADPIHTDLVRLRDLSESLLDPELYAKAIEQLPDALVIIDETGKIIFFNSQAELLFGYSRIETVGQQLEMLLPERVRTRHAGHRDGFFADPRVRPMGVEMPLAGLHKRGNEFPVRINLSPIVTAGGIFGMAVVRKERRESQQ